MDNACKLPIRLSPLSKAFGVIRLDFARGAAISGTRGVKSGNRHLFPIDIPVASTKIGIAGARD